MSLKNEKTATASERTRSAETENFDGQPTSGDDFDVSAPWDSDNQAWWDWYVGLADNTSPPISDRQQHKEAKGSKLDGAVTPVQTVAPDPTTVRPLSLEELSLELATPYTLSSDAIQFFSKQGYIKLPKVLSPSAVVVLRREIVSILEAEFSVKLDSGSQGSEQSETVAQANPGRRFYSADMAWLENPIIRLFVLSPRIAKISADLLGVRAVRLYHDNLLSKEPGCGRTPWHFDDHHFPLATNDVVTAWIAAQAIPRSMGPLAFARGMDTWRLVDDIPFSKADTSYDRRIIETFDRLGVEVDDDPFAVGDVSFHHNLSFHTAGANTTPISRCVLANTFYADGARVMDAPTMVSGDWEKFMPGIKPGDVAASARNPICWPSGTDWVEATNKINAEGRH